MVFAYVGAIIVALLLIGLSSLAVLWVARSVNKGIKRKTLELISAYDELLTVKSESLAKLEETQKIESAPVQTVVVKDSASPVRPAAIPDLTTHSEYRDRNIGSTYRKIRDSFAFSATDAYKSVEAAELSNEVGQAKALLNELPFDTIYKLSSVSAQEQKSILSSCLSGDGKELLDSYCNEHPKFSVIEFYDFLRQTAESEPGVCRMRVSPGGFEGEIPEGVEVIEDPGICEGFQLETGKHVYDYSIRVREIS